MENVLYDITEIETDTNGKKITDIESFVEELNNKTKRKPDGTTDTHEIHYSINYNVKQLSRILDYYGLFKKNLRKDEMIQLIVMFEEDPVNRCAVENRKRLFKNIKELQEDKYFAKFILF